MDWYALYTRSQYERKVACELDRRAIESYLPLLQVTRHWSDREKRTDAPAFPGYVFVRFDALDRVRVLSVVGAVHFLGLSGEPEAIPDVQIDQVRLMLAQPTASTLCALPSKGQTVRIIHGPLTGVYAMCERVNKHCRVTISVPMLNQSVSAEVALSDIEVVKPV